jgi:hypothetical protein
MKHSLLQGLALAAVLFLAGCTTLSTPGVPRSARVVGGGLKIEYHPKESGTAILVEKTTSTTVVTQFVNQSIPFEFDASSESDAKLIRAALPITPEQPRFVLYFVPN